MKRLQAILARLVDIAKLTSDELTGMQAELRDIYSEIRDPETEVGFEDRKKALEDILDANARISTEADERAATEQAERDTLNELTAQLDEAFNAADADGQDVPAAELDADSAGDAGDEDRAEGDDEEDPAAETESDAETDAEPDAVPQPEPVLATGTPPPKPKASPKAAPKVRDRRSNLRLLEGVGERQAGQPITEPEVAEAVCDRLNALQGAHSGIIEKVRVARVDERDRWPAERTLSSDPWDNFSKIRGVTRSLTAAGGVPNPALPTYEIFEIGVEDRPLRDALPRFSDGGRGKVTIPTPRSHQDVGSPNNDDAGSPDQAVDSLTAAQDLAGYTKRYQEFAALSTTDYSVEAVTKITRHGVMENRFWPEEVNHDLHNAAVEYARYSEEWALAKIDAGSVAVTQDSDGLGAARDLLNECNRVAQRYRNYYRMRRSQTLDVLYPDWVISFFQRDAWAAHNAEVEFGALTEADIAGMYANIGVNPIWLPDGYGNDQSPAVSFPNGEAVPADPTIVIWRIFAPGTWAYIDGGVLDLGVVRDATLAKTNRYELFYEEFAQVAKVGIESVKVTQTVCVNGGTAGTITPTDLCNPGS
ncbi:major capsid protein [Nitrosomonas sp.]|uniref:major capsid protein n=1 Tax=Nitrosomonas sp. TaxID=42353 RepID=UPI0025D9B672|nr:major capsid protein [Nitrosomonas sp.]MBV6448526.1 hypothetical protein [Nitrosomonas sp.]